MEERSEVYSGPSLEGRHDTDYCPNRQNPVTSFQLAPAYIRPYRSEQTAGILEA